MDSIQVSNSGLGEVFLPTANFRILRTITKPPDGFTYKTLPVVNGFIFFGDRLQQAHASHSTGLVRWEDILVHVINEGEDPHV